MRPAPEGLPGPLTNLLPLAVERALAWGCCRTAHRGKEPGGHLVPCSWGAHREGEIAAQLSPAHCRRLLRGFQRATLVLPAAGQGSLLPLFKTF